MTVYKDCPVLIGFCREGTFSHLVDKSMKSGMTAGILDLNRFEFCAHVSIVNTLKFLEITIDNDVFVLGNAPIFYRGFYRPFASSERSILLRDALSKIEAGIQLLPKECLVFNRPLAGISNSSKPLHVNDLRDCGFKMPETIHSTCGRSVSSVVAPNHTWVNKGVSGTRTIAESVGGIEVSQLNILSNCPSLFQKKIVGYDVRVHMIQDESASVKIESTKLDYRYAKRQGGEINLTPIDVPASEYYKAIEYMSRSGLNFAGFDFKVDEEGSWWLLEANPMPGFEFFDQYLDDAIATKLLEQMNAGLSLYGKPKNSSKQTFIGVDRIPKVDLGS